VNICICTFVHVYTIYIFVYVYTYICIHKISICVYIKSVYTTHIKDVVPMYIIRVLICYGGEEECGMSAECLEVLAEHGVANSSSLSELSLGGTAGVYVYMCMHRFAAPCS